MIKAKQKEREAKRLEGDIKKEQRHLSHSLRDLDVGVYKIKFISILFPSFCLYLIQM
jgi:hypothetical protein